MASKAELASELAHLRAEMKRREDSPKVARHQTTSQPEPETAANPDSEPATDSEQDHDEPNSVWNKMLMSHGLDPDDPHMLLTQLTEELGDLPENKPLITAIVAFGLGFALGRMSN